ncbi:MAG TPA: cytochrome c biogenesis protein CcdA [Firmicutes bacterium]|jgi:cytochrome c-type biogenesis protein|nr:cytochrome c biogenesis protein CcdA [Bacillota bacterium]
MEYILLFLEGVVTFVSPCLLPMLPIYVSYFVADESNKGRAIINAVGFVIGFTIIFVTMGAFAGTAGKLVRNYTPVLNIVTGIVVIIFGLNFLGFLKIGFLNRIGGGGRIARNPGFLSSLLFGLVFSISWTPCVGAFLASALLMASLGGSLLRGILMLLAFSLGLGIPFIISALLIEQLKGAFAFIKRNYEVINSLSGGLLVAVGILMATGYLGYFLSLLTF